ncbi:hypothetical protein Dsin_013429 [Dipteronia sinensis]|uniref:Uncharacterized protein n=1 Tax=Dipteronia sinensis TaxID=43782 RepID=A0AAE0E937_9ROSI|nr:hypothetical protein Dsin_013429 [Dipteronia sinensis]
METIHRFSLRLLPISLTPKHLTPAPIFYPTRIPTADPNILHRSHSSRPGKHTRPPQLPRQIGFWVCEKRRNKPVAVPPIVKASDPVFHEPAREVDPKSNRVSEDTEDY